jgi:hypothetical protein
MRCSHQLDAVDAAWIQEAAICERLGTKDGDELRKGQADCLPLAILRIEAPAMHDINTTVAWGRCKTAHRAEHMTSSWKGTAGVQQLQGSSGSYLQYAIPSQLLSVLTMHLKRSPLPFTCSALQVHVGRMHLCATACGYMTCFPDDFSTQVQLPCLHTRRARPSYAAKSAAGSIFRVRTLAKPPLFSVSHESATELSSILAPKNDLHTCCTITKHSSELCASHLL